MDRYADRVGENYTATHSPAHQWYYFPRMTRDEAMLLKVWDSEGSIARGDVSNGQSTFSLHSAFKDEAALAQLSTPPKPRESIEVRTVAFFD